MKKVALLAILMVAFLAIISCPHVGAQDSPEAGSATLANQAGDDESTGTVEPGDTPAARPASPNDSIEVPGPAGPQGPQGPRGYIGNRGPQGHSGHNGHTLIRPVRLGVNGHRALWDDAHKAGVVSGSYVRARDNMTYNNAVNTSKAYTDGKASGLVIALGANKPAPAVPKTAAEIAAEKENTMIGWIVLGILIAVVGGIVVYAIASSTGIRRLEQITAQGQTAQIANALANQAGFQPAPGRKNRINAILNAGGGGNISASSEDAMVPPQVALPVIMPVAAPQQAAVQVQPQQQAAQVNMGPNVLSDAALNAILNQGVQLNVQNPPAVAGTP